MFIIPFRYDGIYKVVKYWPQKGQSGFLVWRYLLRRDDPVPAPWTKEGKKRIEEGGWGEIQKPENYEETQVNFQKYFEPAVPGFYYNNGDYLRMMLHL